MTMKTKELIAALQAEDPNGELEVSVGNYDIHFVSTEPAYWDGCLQVLERNPQEKCYNIIGGAFRAEGQKVVITTLSIKSALWNHDDMPVTFDSDYSKEHYEAKVEEWRNEAKAFNAKERK